MNRIVFFFCLLALLPLSNAAKVYEFHLIVYNNDSVGLVSFNISDGKVSAFPSAGEDNYFFRILSADGKVLFNKSFQMGFEAYRFRGPNSTASDVVQLQSVEDYWRLPYHPDATSVELFHGDKKIFQYKLPEEKPEGELSCFSFAALFAILLTAVYISFSGADPGNEGWTE